MKPLIDIGDIILTECGKHQVINMALINGIPHAQVWIHQGLVAKWIDITDVIKCN